MLDGLKLQVETQQTMEKNIDKLSDTTRQSLEFLKEIIKEQREYNEKNTKNIETLMGNLIGKVQKMDQKYTHALSRSSCKLPNVEAEYEI